MTTSNKYKLLIVDDHTENLILLERMLGDLDIEFIRARSGKEALIKIRKHDFTLAIIDIVMPEMNGFETIEMLRLDEKTKFLPVILVTSFSYDKIQLMKGFETGVFDFIIKPIFPELLKAKVKVFLDIAKQRIYLEKYSYKLQQTHDLYRRAIENSDGIPYRFNYNTEVFEFFGNGYQNLFGIDEPFFTLKNLRKIRTELICITPTDIPDPEKYKQAFLNGEIKHYRADFCITNYNKEEKWINDSSVPVLDEVQKNVIGAIGIMQNITDRKKIEKQLRQAQKMEAVGRLAGGVAHDFNNMLTVIRGYSELLLSRFKKNDPIHQKITQINSSAARTEKLTRQLLTFSREEIIKPKVVNINTIINNLKNMLKRLIGEDIKLKTNLSTTIGNIKADPGQVDQIIMNLVINARDAMPNGGMIEINTKNNNIDEDFVNEHQDTQVGEYIQMSIKDTGTGISKEIQSKIFEPFFTTKDADKGTGLGLSTVYGILKQSNAYIWIDSKPEIGTTFFVLFPHIKEKVEKSKKIENKKSDIKGAETILLVEDEFDVRSLVRESLQFYGYNILESDNGIQALELSKENKGKIDLVLTDLVMPEMSGQELGRKLRELIPDIKILYMSGYSDKTATKNEILDENSGFIEKPFSPIDIAQKIRDVLD